MGKNKVRTLLVACVMILFATALIIGGTFALWSDNVSVENHLSAGSLKVKLERINLTKRILTTKRAIWCFPKIRQRLI